MVVLGNWAATLGLCRAWIAGSFHVVMLPKKMFAKTAPVKLRPFVMTVPLASFKLYAGTTALADMGMVIAVVPDGSPLYCAAVIGASDSPKSTTCCVN